MRRIVIYLALASAVVFAAYEILVALIPAWLMLAGTVILVSAGVGFGLWRISFPFNQINRLLQNQVARRLAIAALLTILYASVFYLLYAVGADIVVQKTGVQPRVAWLIVSVLGALAIPAIWHLYSAANIPGDPAMIGRALKSLAFLILIFFGWWFHIAPNQLFDPKTGKPLFLVAEKEGKIYFSGQFSPATGEKLRRGTPKDAERFQRQSWLESWLEKVKVKVAGVAAGIVRTQPRFPFCNDAAGIRAKIPGIVEVPLQPDCWSAPVYLPATVERYWITLDNGPGAALFVRYPDGRVRDLSVDDAPPEYIPWSSIRLRGEGTVKVILRPLRSANEVSKAR